MGNSEEVAAGEVNEGYVPTEEKVKEDEPPPYSSDVKENETSVPVDIERKNHNPNFQNENDGMRNIGSMSASEIKQEKMRIWKNVAVISLSFMCLFTAFNSVGNLQSSINADAGLGTTASATIYVALIVSCMFVPTWLIKTIKCKWTMVFCELCYSVYIIAQFWPSFATLIPAAIILGIGAAPMWSAKCTYLTQVGNRYAALIGDKSAEPSITRFFGFFFMVFQTSQIWGNLISSLVLSMDKANETIVGEQLLEYCGANFCNSRNLTNITGDGSVASPLERPDEDKIQMLTGILLGFALLASLIMALLVDPLSRFGEEARQGSSTGKTGVELLLATFQHMKNPYQLLIIPLTLWSGFEQAFLTADFTAAYISCSWGVQHVGFVLICYGAADAIGSITCGSIVKRVGRVPIFIFGALLNAGLIIALFLWQPDPSNPVIFFVIAAFWGLADSIWQTQINSFYGVIFAGSEEAAFSNYRLWESLGFAIAFAYSYALCANAKLWVLVGILIAGMTGYLIIEIIESKKFKKTRKE
ncbi:hypothetical protein GHT06_019391 [Daphnia sinensis]|uniref:UNC93-like protein n=1 Tax=Daphnia sinensis TaxID=1820382 RepID=A0AAD5KK19_9CRUS|nr:hypothetical protein GHT06_019391 [Daphnia sinensis]